MIDRLNQRDANMRNEADARDDEAPTQAFAPARADAPKLFAEADPIPLEALRIAEALLFASAEPLEEKDVARRMPEGAKARLVLEELRRQYAHRGVNLFRVNGKWFFRTAADLSWLMAREVAEPKKLSRAALETLAIVAYHQPVTRAEIEQIRGVAVAKGTIDVLMETNWIRMRGRRKAPGRPITYGTTEDFLIHFGVERIGDLPGLDELRGAGLLEGRLPAGFGVPTPNDDRTLLDDEDPLEEGANEEPELPLDMHALDEMPRVEPDEEANDDEPGASDVSAA
jgi:segregation and condensation protein B